MRDLGVVLAALLGVSCSGKVQIPVFEVSSALKAKVRVETSVRVAPAPVAMSGSEVVEFFGVPLEGAQDIVFVLDRSGSMADLALGEVATIAGPMTEPGVAAAPRKIDVARAELLDALDRLPEGTRLNVIFFNNTLEAFAPSVGILDEQTRPKLAAFVRETQPRGSTALATAMRLAFVMNAKRVVLLSDGLGNLGGNGAAVLRDAREAMLGDVRIDTIGLGVDQNARLLDTLARESGGLYQAL